jgi:hypothetical protein
MERTQITRLAERFSLLPVDRLNCGEVSPTTSQRSTLIGPSESKSVGKSELAVLVLPRRVYDAHLVDLDGSICLSNQVLAGAGSLVAALRDLGKNVHLLTNNPTSDPER